VSEGKSRMCRINTDFVKNLKDISDKSDFSIVKVSEEVDNFLKNSGFYDFYRKK